MKTAYLKSSEDVRRLDDGLQTRWVAAHTSERCETIKVVAGKSAGQVVVRVGLGAPEDPLGSLRDTVLTLAPWAARHLACLLVRTADALDPEGER